MQRFSLSAIRIRGEMSAPLGFAIGIIAGAAGYVSLPFEPSRFGLFISAVLIWACFAWCRRILLPRSLISLLIILCGAASGAVAGKLAMQRVDHSVIAAPTGPVLLEGWVRAAQPGRSGIRLVIQVHAIDGFEAKDTPERVRLTHILSLNTEPGRFVRCWAVLRPPPQPVVAGDYDFARQAWFSGLGAVGYVQGRCRGGALGRPSSTLDQFALTIGTWRRRLAQYVNQAAGERAGGFAAALASGDRSFMRLEDQDALRASGLAHLLAISGLHIGIVGGLVFVFLWRVFALIEPIALRWSVKKPAALGALIACAAYLTISGASLSTQRAFIMSAVAFAAILFDRTALSLRSLAIAMIIIIAIAPWSVLTPGFQMSFAATGGLIATYEAWRRQRRQSTSMPRHGLWFWAKSLIVTSTVSGLATAPFALFHFERVAALGLLANFAAMPIISLISAPLAGAALLLAPLGLDGLALRLFGFSLELVLWIAHNFADEERSLWSSLPKMPAASLVLFAGAILAYAMLASWLEKAVGVLVISALAFGVWSLNGADRVHWAPSGELFLEHAYGGVERIEVMNGDGLAPLRFADMPISRACRPSEACSLNFSEHSFRFFEPTHEGATNITLAIMRRDGSTAATLYWRDVIKENGITLERRGNQFDKRSKPSCGRRPWRPCPDS